MTLVTGPKAGFSEMTRGSTAALVASKLAPGTFLQQVGTMALADRLQSTLFIEKLQTKPHITPKDIEDLHLKDPFQHPH